MCENHELSTILPLGRGDATPAEAFAELEATDDVAGETDVMKRKSILGPWRSIVGALGVIFGALGRTYSNRFAKSASPIES